MSNASWIYPRDGSVDEWHVVIRCDGVPTDFRVRRRFGEAHHEGKIDAIETFELLKSGEVCAILTFPVGGDLRTRAKEAAMRTINRALGCSEIMIETDGDPAEALFGPDATE